MSVDTLTRLNDKLDLIINRMNTLESKVDYLEVTTTNLDKIDDAPSWFATSDVLTYKPPAKLDVFDAILMKFETSDHGARLRYILPRGVGTTTTLVNLSKFLLSQGHSVRHLVSNQQIATELNEKFNVDFIDSLVSFKHYYLSDYIICDNCSSELIPTKVYLEIQSVDY